MKTVTAEQLKQKLDNNDDFVLVNVLPKDHFEGRHVPKSVNIPVDELDKRLYELPDKDKEIVVYCASKECTASTTALRKLEEKGYTNVIEFEDGVAGWQQAGFEMQGNAV